MNASKVRLIAAYGVLWIVYLAATFALFPILNISCVIPVILIVGIGAWSFGTTAGLIATLLSLIHNFFLTGIVYADIIEFYQYTLNGYILLPTISYLLGHLRVNLDALKETNRKLDQRVAQRTNALSHLTSRLLENSENLKNSRGQELHDGIGQQLTGIQLISSAIAEQLLSEKNTYVSMADTISRKSATTHIQIRRISRLLFPIKIGKVDFKAALRELVAALEEIKPVNIHITFAQKFLPDTSELKLQFYRICQEETLFIMNHEMVQKISINLNIKDQQRLIRIKRALVERAIEAPRPLLSNYRIKMASGSFREFMHSGQKISEYSFPLTDSV